MNERDMAVIEVPMLGKAPFKIKTMFFDKNFVQAVPFLDANGEIDVLITTSEEAFGLPVSGFEDNTPATGCRIGYQWLVDSGLLQGIARSELKGNTVGGAGLGIPIVRVTRNEKDTIRAVYSTHETIVPDVIITQDVELDYRDQPRHRTVYFDMDPGHVLCIGRDGFARVYRSVDAQTHIRCLPIRHMALKKKAEEYQNELHKHKAAYVDKFLEDEIEHCFVSIFIAKDNALTYSDTVIRIEDTEKYKAVVATLINREYQANDFELILRTMVLASSGVEFFVNGTSIMFERKATANHNMLNYINGKKISQPDIIPVINRVTCYPDDSAGYQLFVDTASKVSMKFHRSVNEGIELRIPAELMSILRDQCDMDGLVGMTFPGDSHHRSARYSHAPASMALQFKKQSGKRSQVKLFGEWRGVTNYDMFVDRCYEPLNKSGRQRYANLVISNTIHRGYTNPHAVQTEKAWQALERNENTGYVPDAPVPPLDIVKCRLLVKFIGELDMYIAPEDRVLLPGGVNPQTTRYGAHELVGSERMFDLVRTIRDGLAAEFVDYVVEVEERAKKSKEFLDEAIARTNTEVSGDGSERKYRVPGRSGTMYIINSEGRVSTTNSSSICIVNGGVSDQFGFDYLTSLIVALAQDKYTARKITTLNRHIAVAS